MPTQTFNLTDEQRKAVLRFYRGAGRYTNDLKDIPAAAVCDHRELVRALVIAGVLEVVRGRTRGTVYTLSALGEAMLEALTRPA